MARTWQSSASYAQIQDLSADEKAENVLIGTAWKGNLNGLPMDLYLLERHRLVSKIGEDQPTVQSWFIKGDKIKLSVIHNGGIFSLQGAVAGSKMRGTGLNMKGPAEAWEAGQQTAPLAALVDKAGPAGIIVQPHKANPIDFTGVFKANFPANPGKSSDQTAISVECDPALSCIVKQDEDQQEVFDYISQVRWPNFSEARLALNYAREHKSNAKQQAPYLASLLDSSGDIESCIDLRKQPQQPSVEPSEPGYLLLCKPTQKFSNKPTVILMSTILANCGEAFCRFALLPLQKER